MLDDALQHCIFPLDPYAIPEDFVVNTTNTLLQNERAEQLRQLQVYGGNERMLFSNMECLKMESLDDIRNLLTTLEWLKNELNQETLSDVKLYYIEDMIGGYGWTIEGKVSADTAISRQFKLEFTNTFYEVIDVSVGGSLIRTFNFRPDMPA